MTNSRKLSGLALLLWVVLGLASADAKGALRHFVRVDGDQLYEGNKPFRFISFNIPNLHLVEDNVAFDTDNAWRWPDRFEIADALESIRQQGGLVTRSYVLSVVRTNDPPGVPRHVLGPGKFNEEGFRVLDEVLRTANEKGVRVIIPFVDNWSWWGGITEYAGFRGKLKEAFWTDPQVIADFKRTVEFLITRTNTLTGVPYRDDKAILCWETGNEVQSPPAWTREIARFIHSLDKNHPVMDGYNTTELRGDSLEMPEIDIVTTHHYPGTKKSFAELIRENAAKAKGKKPYVVGEFGFVEMPKMVEAVAAVRQTQTAGALAWSLRYRNRDGGFYWHSEPAGGDKYKSFHWPGFPTGDDYDESEFLAMMQREAFGIRGLAVPRPKRPSAPSLLPASSVSLSWQGSAGALTYQVERAPARGGSWQVVADAVDETQVQYRPLFVDSTAGQGEWKYRVRARNSSGLSRPSNVLGPIRVTHGVLVDEMADVSALAEHSGELRVSSNECRKAKEDIHRLAGTAGSSIVYQLPGPALDVRVFSFFPSAAADFKFAVSSDGKTFQQVTSRTEVLPTGAGDYGYWKPAIARCRVSTSDARWIRIEYGAPAQVGRVEIDYSK